jgi:2-haloacid dehalogenase
MRLTDFKVLTFDCYGTLIDWESGMTEPIEGSSPDPANRSHRIRFWKRMSAMKHTRKPKHRPRLGISRRCAFDGRPRTGSGNDPR